MKGWSRAGSSRTTRRWRKRTRADRQLRRAVPGLFPAADSLISTFLKPRIPVSSFCPLPRSFSGSVPACCSAFRGARRARSSTADRRPVRCFLRVPPVLHRAAAPSSSSASSTAGSPDPGYVVADRGFGSFLSDLFLPALTLALIYMAAYVRITRAYVLESLGEDYLRTAKAKGLRTGASSSSTRCARRSRPSSPWPASTSVGCSAARSSPRRSSTTTASASWPVQADDDVRPADDCRSSCCWLARS